MNLIKKIFLFLTLACSANVFATPPAGANITNTAQASYLDSGGNSRTINSNTVISIVSTVYSFIIQNNQNRVINSPQTITFQHYIENTGNEIDTYNLSTTLLAGTTNLGTVTIYPDANGDTVADSLTPISITPPINPGARYYFIVSINVPVNTGSSTRDIRINASSVGNNSLINNNIDRITYNEVNSLLLEKIINPAVGASPTTTEDITVTIRYTNTSATDTLTNVSIIDLFESNSSIKPHSTYLTDAINGIYNTEKISYTLQTTTWSKSGSLLTDQNDGLVSASGSSVNFTYDNSTKLWKAIISSLSPGETGNFSYKIKILPNAPLGTSKTNNSVSSTYFVGPTKASTTSNNAIYEINKTNSPLDFVIEKIAPDKADFENNFNYLLRIKNIGFFANTSSFTVTDRLPKGVEIVSISSDAGTTCNQSDNINNGIFVTCTITTPLSPFVSPSTNIKDIVIMVNLNEEYFKTISLPTIIKNTAQVSSTEETNEALTNNTSNEVSTTIGEVLSSSVSGRVWFDINHDKKYGSGDKGLKGFIVNICFYDDNEDKGIGASIKEDKIAGFIQTAKNPNTVVDCNEDKLATNINGNKIKSVLTNSSGFYEIKNLDPTKKYKIQFRAPDGKTIVGQPLNQMKTKNSFLHWSKRFLVIDPEPGINYIDQNLPLDPSGVVYDSGTREPVAGAIVTIKGPSGFDPDKHLLGGKNNVSQITKVKDTPIDGMYQFILVGNYPLGVYSLEILTPENYRGGFSTLYPPEKNSLSPPIGCTIFANRCSVEKNNIPTAPPKSIYPYYYTSFEIKKDSLDVINNHLPIDPIDPNAPAMLLNKQSSKRIVDIGEMLQYTIKINNAIGKDITKIKVEDELPIGFIYKNGSTIFNGKPYEDPQIINNKLIFDLKDYVLSGEPGAEPAILNYHVIVTGATTNFPGKIRKNKAQANAEKNRKSNISVAEVELFEGVFNNKSYIIGKVKTVCDKEELGVPNVRIWLSNGSFTITDSMGKFSFYGLEAKSQSIKLDKITIPEKTIIINDKTRQLLDSSSYLIDLRKSDLYKADFNLECNDELIDFIRTKKSYISNEIENATKQLSYENPIKKEKNQLNNVSSNGFKDDRNKENLNTSKIKDKESEFILKEIEKADVLILEDFVSNKDLNKEKINIYYPKELKNVKSQDNILISFTNGNTVELFVNDVLQKDDKIGKKTIDSAQNILANEYVAINFAPGKNIIKIVLKDPFGNKREEKERIVYSAGAVENISIAKPSNMSANGISVYKIKLSIFDKNNIPVNTRMPFTIEGQDLSWVINDLDKNEAGIQNFIENSETLLSIKAPVNSGSYKFKIRIGNIVSEESITFSSDLRPMVATGIIEGVFNTNKMKDQLLPINSSDVFEDKIEAFSRDNNRLRTVFFLKGKIYGDKLLTLAYDSDKNTKEKIFRDLDPEKYYPVYGDSSIKGFDAQSTSKLFVKIEKDNNYLMYGDYSTSASSLSEEKSSTNLQISNYNRLVTGFKGKYEKNKQLIDTWLSYTNTAQVVDLIKAQGLSGPYTLSNPDIVINSEIVEIITRDRFNPSLIINRESKARFNDYEIDYLTSRIVFKNPISGFDKDNNPIYIQVSYEVENGKKHLLGGINYQKYINDKTKVGATVVIDKNPSKPAELVAGYIEYKTDKTKILSEIAVSNTEKTAGAISISGEFTNAKDENKKIEYTNKININKTDKDFYNPSSSVLAGNTELKASTEIQINPKLKIELDFTSLNDKDDQNKDMYLLTGQYSITENYIVKTGLRHVVDDTFDENIDSFLTRLTYKKENFETYVEYEQELANLRRKIFALGAEVRPTNKLRIYGRHEFESELAQSLANSSSFYPKSTAGIDYSMTSNLDIYNQYKDSISSKGENETTLSTGLKSKYDIKNIKFTAQVEQIKAINNGKQEENVINNTAEDGWSASFGIDYSKENQKLNSRYEYKKTESEKSDLLNFGYGVKIDENYTFLNRASMYTLKSESPIQKHRVVTGLAYRPDYNDTWNHLFKYEYLRELVTDQKLQTHAISMHTNYSPIKPVNISNRIAFKKLRELYLGEINKFNGYLLSGRFSYDINNRVDVAALYSIYNDNMKIKSSGLGLEIGLVIDKNFLLALGYSQYLMSYEEWVGNKPKTSGFYVKLKAKFDEDSYFIKQLDKTNDKK